MMVSRSFLIFLLTNVRPQCKHVLAVHLAEASGAVELIQVTDEEFGLKLFGMLAG